MKIFYINFFIIFWSEVKPNVNQIYNNWNSYFINNFDDVMKKNEKKI